MAKVAYVHTDEDGSFSFHRADGSLVKIAGKAFETDDAALIAYLDSVPFVKRASKKASGGEEG